MAAISVGLLGQFHFPTTGATTDGTAVLLAIDDRIAAGAGFAPVTDWRKLTEFA